MTEIVAGSLELTENSGKTSYTVSHPFFLSFLISFSITFSFQLLLKKKVSGVMRLFLDQGVSKNLGI